MSDYQFVTPDPRREPDIPDRRIDRYRLPGWTAFAEAAYRSRRRVPRKPGRQTGSSLFPTPLILATYAKFAQDKGRRPTREEAAYIIGCSEGHLRRIVRERGLTV